MKHLIQKAHKIAEEHGFHMPEGLNGVQKIHYKLAKVALMHSELSEAAEAIRKPDMKDHHLPKENPLGVELADAVIRIMDFCAEFDLDLEGLIIKKMNYNADRPYLHGKKA